MAFFKQNIIFFPFDYEAKYDLVLDRFHKIIKLQYVTLDISVMFVFFSLSFSNFVMRLCNFS